MNKKICKLSNKGFTLIELIVVMAIIAILVLLAAPKFLGYTKDAEVSAMQADAKVLSNAATLYYIEEGTWPAGADFTITTGALETYLKTIGFTDGDTACELDETKLDNYVKSISNDYDNYILITKGVLAGEVFHRTGVTDKNYEIYYGAYNVN